MIHIKRFVIVSYGFPYFFTKFKTNCCNENQWRYKRVSVYNSFYQFTTKKKKINPLNEEWRSNIFSEKIKNKCWTEIFGGNGVCSMHMIQTMVLEPFWSYWKTHKELYQESNKWSWKRSFRIIPDLYALTWLIESLRLGKCFSRMNARHDLNSNWVGILRINKNV